MSDGELCNLFQEYITCEQMERFRIHFVFVATFYFKCDDIKEIKSFLPFPLIFPIHVECIIKKYVEKQKKKKL